MEGVLIQLDSVRMFDKPDVAEKMEKQNYKCSGCGSEICEGSMCGDHILPWSKGGPTALWNLQVLCVSCNSSKSDLYPIQWAMLSGAHLDDAFFDGMAKFLKTRRIEKRPKKPATPRPKRAFEVCSDIPPPNDEDITYCMPNAGKEIPELNFMDVGDSIHIPYSNPGGAPHATVMKFEEDKDKRFKVRSAKPKGIRIWRVK